MASDYLESARPFPEALYEGMDLTGLAAYTLRWLQGRNTPATFENIVVAAFRMFPRKFSLEGYPNYPDAARVGRTLMQLGPKYRNWARGSVQKGFVLTESGASKAGKIQEALVTSTAPPLPRTGKPKGAQRTMDLSKELQSLEESPPFRGWAEGNLSSSTPLDLLNMLGAYAYTPARVLRERVSFLERAASQIGRGDLVAFLQAVRETFASQFRDS